MPTPALESAVTGLNVTWSYRGADGEEHSWENITGTTLTAGNYKWHYGAIDDEMAKTAAKDLDEYSAERIARCGKEFA